MAHAQPQPQPHAQPQVRARVTDLVVVLPGIMGSSLAAADGTPLWDLSAGALGRALRTFGRSVKGLRLPGDLGDDHPGDGVVPAGVMPDVHGIPGIWRGVDGYTGLLDWLERSFTLSRPTAATPGNLLVFPYDWRLSCRYNAGLLASRTARELERWRAYLYENREAEVVFVGHSLGGLVARDYVERLGGHEITRRLITLGTPHRGSLDSLAHLVNGLRKGWGRFGIDVTDFARSLPSLHQLVPDYACVKGPGGLAYARDLPGLPGADPGLLKDAARFHADLRTAADRPAPTELHPIAGIDQPTLTTAEFGDDDLLLPLWDIDGRDELGDGTVPRLSARPANAGNSGYAVAEAHTPCDQHGALQNNKGVRDALHGLLGHPLPFHRGGEDDGVPLGVLAPAYLPTGEPYEVAVTVPPGARRYDELLLEAELRPAAGGAGTPARTLRNLGGGRYAAVFGAPAPGGYRLTVRAAGRPGPTVTALSVVGGGADE